ncbi:NADPH:quinone reductase [Stenotrophomonas maltophilia]|uniref:NADPH:quinone reductase n=1 Tax=Stenotrophomonas maltophilia TaxID=40324 RepID=UPI0010AA2599|nr:NADPH:quinone reductase [Stenotrophomonas maltophilia]TIE21839.1 alcohol dehydrogenase [Stenotrophomonas maltophilia]TIE65814.1 alcohol dehydrogenase [Stenotrophomonas maltophilia]HEL7748614.1 NADPH:quinone reductase [Stenotrophomonas maltophilia]
MRAAYYDRQGPADEVLCVAELPTPQPGPGEVRVRMHMSGLNPTDLKARTGFSAPMPFPRIIPHQDGAGVIDAVGDPEEVGRIGQRVWIYEAQYGRASGTAAAFVVVPAGHAVPLPGDVSFEVGASLGIPALTAHRCLFADGDINGRRVLVQGGAGVVGTAAVLLAKWAGAWVAVTVMNAEQAIIARAAGADLVLDRLNDDVAGAINTHTRGAGVDRIVEVNVQANLDLDLACLASGGVISAYAAAQATDELSLPLLRAMVHGCVLRFVYIYSVPQEAKIHAIRDITACLASGAYSPHVGLKVDLQKIAEAHQALEAGTVVGKVLIAI